MKIHLLLKKEDIDIDKMKENNKIAIVLDVLLATTTIISALNDGAKEVIPVKDSEEAKRVAQGYEDGGYLIAGELDAKPLPGFHYPSPLMLRKLVKDKTLILSTTNGTVALRKASTAQKVYISSLLNNQIISETVKQEHDDCTLLIICSGNAGEVSLEDFYGAGHLIDCFDQLGNGNIHLSDAAQAAHYLYKGNQQNAYDILLSSHVGKLFAKHGLLEDLKYASRKDFSPIIPVLKDGRVIIEKPRKERVERERIFYGTNRHED